MGFQSVIFVVTPEELKEALLPFNLFIGNAHVPIDYRFTPTEVFINNYAKMLEKLCNGDKIDSIKDSGLLNYFNITTDIASIRFGREHLYEGKMYKYYQDSVRGYAPYFSPFTFSVYGENNKVFVGTHGSWHLEYLDIMGFQLYYPKLTKNEAVACNVSSEKDWESYSDYKLFKDYIAKHTEPFKFEMNGIVKKTQIRISPNVKTMLSNFHCIKKYNIKIY